MNAVLHRPGRVRQFAAVFLALVGLAPAQADIFQWEYINPTDPSQGKRQSTTLAPDGAGVDAAPAVDLSGRDLTMAYLEGADFSPKNVGGPIGPGADLTAADLSQAALKNARFALALMSGTKLNQADLINANFHAATLTGANFMGAEIRGASFGKDSYYGGTGITLAQLYSTDSYQTHDLSGIGLVSNNLSGGNFAGQNLTDANLNDATLADANFSRANLTNAYLSSSTLTGADLSQANLTNAYLAFSNLTGANLRQANLANAYLLNATLTGADFTNAEVRGASFVKYGEGGITLAQLYSTASYQARDLSRIGLTDLASGNFAGQNLSNAGLGGNLTGSNFSQANLASASFGGADLTGANFRDANLTNADFATYSCSPELISPNCYYAYATVTGADFTGAEVRGANLAGTGVALDQLYSTASYQAKDLSGIGLGTNNLAGANFGGQHLTKASFSGANLRDADFTDADIRGASFAIEIRHVIDGNYRQVGSGITPAQLYSTASYQAHNLSGIDLSNNGFGGANFANQDLTNSNFNAATLTGADLAGAEVRGASFTRSITDVCSPVVGCRRLEGGITLAQLYSTASYQAHDLTRLVLQGNDLSGGDFSGQNLTNASFYYATLTDANFTGAEVRGASFGGLGVMSLAQLYSTASYHAHDLTGIGLDGNSLIDGNFSRQNLTNANFRSATLRGADFAGAEVRGADFSETTWPTYRGFTAAQLYSTASYQSHDLTGIKLDGNNLRGWSFAGQNLADSDIGGWLNGADFTAADIRGSSLDSYSIPEDAITTNLITNNGHINGLDLDGGGLLVVRDYDGGSPYNSSSTGPTIPITIDQHLTMRPSGTLRMVFEADAWDSTISFALGIPVTLGGTLELTFADDVNLATQVGRTLRLFDWTGVHPTGAFTVSSMYAWDLSNLYTTGEVTLTAIPEPQPGSIALIFAGIVLHCVRSRTTGRSRFAAPSR